MAETAEYFESVVEDCAASLILSLEKNSTVIEYNSICEARPNA